MEWLAAKLGVEAVQYAAGGAVAVVVAYALKKIPNATIKANITFKSDLKLDKLLFSFCRSWSF